MRLTALVFATLAMAPGLSAQEPSPARGLPVHGAPPVQLVERPSDVVARLAREALTAPGDTATWKALAGALPAMALSGGADLEGTFEAARIADSLSAASGLLFPRVTMPSGSPEGASEVRGASVAGVLDLPVQLVGGLMLGVVFLAGVLVFRRRRRRPESPTPAPAGAGRLWTARTLATGGVDIPDIARRTGMAQEAVNLTLRLAGEPPEVTGLALEIPGTVAPTPRARDERQARLRREVNRGVDRLRDRRLTYGGRLAS